MRGIAAALGLVLVAASGLLVVLILGQAVDGSRYADWRETPLVLVAELAIGVGAVALAIGALVEVSRRPDDTTVTDGVVLLEAGVGMLAVAALAIAAGWVGLQAPTTAGYDVLERAEPVWIVAGVAAGGFGLLVIVTAAVVDALRRS